MHTLTQSHYSRSTPLQRMVICGMMIAVSAVLSAYFKIPVTLFGSYSLKISFDLVPVYIVSTVFGPLYGAIVAALADIIQALLAPVGGAYNPLFTITALSIGMIQGLFFIRGPKITFPRLIISVAAAQITGSVILNTIFLCVSYGLPFSLIWARLVTQAVMIPLVSVLTFMVLKLLSRGTHFLIPGCIGAKEE